MRKNSIKNTRINGEVQRELSRIISREIKDPRIAPMTSVVDAVVTSDLKQCKAYISVLGNDEEKEEYLRWLIDLEYNKNKIPEPDIVIFLKMPIDKAKELMENRKNKIDGSEKKDIHEVNEDYLKKSYENATAISKKYNWCEIECVENNEIKSIEKINDEIFSKIKEIIGG